MADLIHFSTHSIYQSMCKVEWIGAANDELHGRSVVFFRLQKLVMVPEFQQSEFFFLVYNSLFVIFFRWRSASAVKRAMEDKVRCIISTSKVWANEKI